MTQVTPQGEPWWVLPDRADEHVHAHEAMFAAGVRNAYACTGPHERAQTKCLGPGPIPVPAPVLEQQILLERSRTESCKQNADESTWYASGTELLDSRSEPKTCVLVHHANFNCP